MKFIKARENTNFNRVRVKRKMINFFRVYKKRYKRIDRIDYPLSFALTDSIECESFEYVHRWEFYVRRIKEKSLRCSASSEEILNSLNGWLKQNTDARLLTLYLWKELTQRAQEACINTPIPSEDMTRTHAHVPPR